MAHYGFEGDIDNISERQLQFINSVIVKLGFVNSKVIFEPVGLAGDNYVANVKRMTIDGDYGSLKIIAKIAPTLENIRQTMNTAMMFKNEHIMYTEVMPTFVQLQKDAEIPDEDRLRFAACYGSFSEQPNEVILLEDLKMSDFIMLDRFTSLSDDCVKSALKNFAVLHALSFALKNKGQELYNNLKKDLTDDWSTMAKMEYVKTYFKALEKDTLAILEDQKHIDFLKDKVTNTLHLAIKLSAADVINKYAVIQHGDLKTNNIMFRFEDDNLIDSVMIDYQNSRSTSPASDLLYMIFNSTNHETRIQNFHDWINYYYSELEKSLSNFNLKVDVVYPREILDSDLKKYSNLIFGISIFLASILIRKTHDVEKMKDAMSGDNLIEQTQDLLVSTLDDESKTLFKNKVIGLIESCSELRLM